MQSGLYYGYAGLVDSMVDRISEEMGRPLPVVATGGFAEKLRGVCSSIETIDPLLTLEGLRIIHERRTLA